MAHYVATFQKSFKSARKECVFCSCWGPHTVYVHDIKACQIVFLLIFYNLIYSVTKKSILKSNKKDLFASSYKSINFASYI